MRRREFLAALASAAVATPRGARGQPAALPVIGFLSSGSPSAFASFLAAFHAGLNEAGFAEGRNIAIEYRWSEGNYDKLREQAADLVQRRVALIAATGGLVSARAAMAATDRIPVLFISGFDPALLGMVASIGRPGGNATGVSLFTTELIAKRLQLLSELVPSAKRVALLLNPDARLVSGIERAGAETAARLGGMELLVLEARADDDLEPAFAAAVDARADALVISGDPYFTDRRVRIVALSARHQLPTAYPWRQYVVAGGLMSYGPSITEAYQQIGDYAARILKGADPGELPIQLPTKFEFVINIKAANELGLAIPPLLNARINEAIE